MIKLKEEQKVLICDCLKCGRKDVKHLGTHLIRTHGITGGQYLELYPDAKVSHPNFNPILKEKARLKALEQFKNGVSKETRDKMGLSSKARKHPSGYKFTPEQCKNVSTGLKGHECSEETKRKISESQKKEQETRECPICLTLFEVGINSPQRTCSEECGYILMGRSHIGKPSGSLGKLNKRKGISNIDYYGEEKAQEIKLKISNSMLLKWQEKEYRNNTIKAIINGLYKRPTSYEEFLIYLIDKYKLPFRYVGDGSLIVGYVNPDFVDTLGVGLYIEPHYCWNKEAELQYRENRHKNMCVDKNKVLILVEEDFKDKNRELNILNKVMDFLFSHNIQVVINLKG